MIRPDRTRTHAFRAAIALFLAGSAAGPNLWARDVPFADPAEAAAIPSAGEAAILADLDGDATLDLVAASGGGTTIARHRGAGDGTFGEAVAIAADLLGVRALAAGDLDGDGDRDLVAATSSGARLLWFANLGGGAGFGPARTILDDFPGADSIALVDLDRDGTLDVVASASSTLGPKAFLNILGTGDFSQGGAAGTTPLGPIAVGDFDRDGRPDVVGASATALLLYRGFGDGTFVESTIQSDAGPIVALAVADFDGDGDADVAALSAGDSSLVLYVNDSGGFGAPVVAGAGLADPRSLATADFDRDGDADVAVVAGNGSASSGAWYENAGSLQFSRREIFAPLSDAARVLAADADGDGDADVAFLERAANRLSIAANRLSGRSAIFPEIRTIATGFDAPEFVKIGDLNRDGRPDLVGASLNDDRVVWFRNLGGSFAAARTLASDADAPREVALVDFDRDGDLDAISASSADSRLLYMRNTGGSNFAAAVPLATDAGEPFGLSLGDLDRDGHLDAVVAARALGSAVRYRNLGDGTLASPSLIGAGLAGAYSVRVGDLDGDGDNDVVGAGNESNSIAWFRNTGNAFGPAITLSSTAQGAAWVDIADIDGDGRSDVLFASMRDDKIAWCRNLGGEFAAESPINIPDPDGTVGEPNGNANSARRAVPFDLDGDGDIDVLSASSVDGKLAMYENLGGGTFGPQVVLTQGTELRSADGADLDGDGDADIAFGWTGADSYAWLPNHGGEFALVARDAGEDEIEAGVGTEASVLTVEGIHRGRAGDVAMEISILDFEFRSEAGQPLDAATARAFVSNLSVYADDGNGTFDGADTLEGSVSTSGLAGGGLSLPLASPGVAEVGSPAVWHVVVRIAPDAPLQIPPRFRVAIAGGFARYAEFGLAADMEAVGGGEGPTVVAVPSVVPSTLGNISTRGYVGTGDEVMIAGFIVEGPGSKRVLVSGIGPDLANFGVASPLANPTLQLFRGGSAIAVNDDWMDSPNQAEIAATLPPNHPLEAAILTDLAPGAYTAILSGVDAKEGIGLVQAFDVGGTGTLSNLSTRLVVGSGERVMIAGFVVQGDTSRRLLIRGLGPTLGLPPFNVPGTIPDPELRLFSGADEIAANGDWRLAANAAAIVETGLAPPSDMESAILVELPAGSYTAILLDRAGAEGTGLVEVYDVQE